MQKLYETKMMEFSWVMILQKNFVQIATVMRLKFISPDQSYLKWEKPIFYIPYR